ncbi:MAG TPA: radical SAM family heme chaperone HemW [Gemmatimonadales bacterium]|nr:radical SAM family heme chaperone HemW [Gemmatimonadales bacterium]
MRHLYVHVPFCRRRCSYCDFSIAVRRRVPAREYIDAISRELELVRTADPGAMPHESDKTVYLGGGTPSLLPADALAILLPTLLAAVGASPATESVEVTLEANPEDVTPETAGAWRQAGVNRVSLGAQSFDDRVLQWMHRPHDASRIGEAVHAIRGAGIDNISLDLIFALPVELRRNWGRDLDEALSLLPSHLSLYGLTVEERTPLARWVSRGAASAPDEERYADEYLFAHERLAREGYRFYEVSNAAREGRRSRHNSAYWSGHPYRGLGPAAHSYDGRARRWNVSAWDVYRRAVAAGRSPVESEEVLTEDQRELEGLYLSLRTDAGLPLADLYRPLPTSADLWLQRGWVEHRDQRLVCTPEGWLRLDTLVHALTGRAGVS